MTKQTDIIKELTRLRVTMNVIEEDIPLTLEYNEDARYIWPKRWKKLKECLDDRIETATEENPYGIPKSMRMLEDD